MKKNMSWGKKALFWAIGLTVGLLVLLSCQTSLGVKEPLKVWQKEDRMWVITDLHYLSPKLFDQGPAFEKIKKTAAGKELTYGAERMEMLIAQIEKAKPQVLIVSGDLTLNGEYQSMVELRDYFSRIEELGTAVYLIPGNHDISSGWAREFVEDRQELTRQVLPENFKELFADFGYTEAVSLDKETLSYRVNIAQDLGLLMIDSNNYSQTEGEGAPITAGDLPASTLSWISQELAQAQEDGVRLLPVLHHNSLPHFSLLSRHYTLDNASDLQEVLKEGKVPVTLSGHIHVQDIAQTDGLTDIVTGAFASYPSAIGQISLDEGTFHYQRLTLNSQIWLEAEGKGQLPIKDFSAYMKQVLEEDAQRIAYAEMIEGDWYEEEAQADRIALYFGELNRSFFAGELSEDYEDLNRRYATEKRMIEGEAGRQFQSYLQMMEEQSRDNQLELHLTWPLVKDK